MTAPNPAHHHHKSRYRTHEGRTHIDLNLRHIDQLFDSRDPSPFLERDLDDNAADYILTAAMEHSPNTPLALTIHISEPEQFTLSHEVVIEAIHSYFEYNAELTRRKLHQVFRQGRYSLLIGVLMLFTCLTISQSIEAFVVHSYIRAMKEGLVIMGWVAMWRPIDIFLYSWRPQLEAQRMYEKLSHVPVAIKLLKPPVKTP